MGEFYYNKYGAWLVKCSFEQTSGCVLMAVLVVLKINCFMFMFNKSPKGYNHVY